MMHVRSTRSVLLLLTLAAVLTGCIKGTPLKTSPVDAKAVSGTYDLMLYGCRHPNDLETAAFLIDPAKADKFELFVLPTSYKTQKGLTAETAFEKGNAFLHCGVRTVEKTVARSIPDGAGGTIGYELLPHYSPMDEGGQRPLIVNYSLRDGKVTVFLELDPSVRRSANAFSPPGASGP